MLTQRLLELLPASWHFWLIGPWGPLHFWWSRCNWTADQKGAMTLPWRDFLHYWWTGHFVIDLGLSWSEDVNGFEYRTVLAMPAEPKIYRMNIRFEDEPPVA